MSNWSQILIVPSLLYSGLPFIHPWTLFSHIQHVGPFQPFSTLPKYGISYLGDIISRFLGNKTVDMISALTNPVRYVHSRECSLLSCMKAASFFLINAASCSLEFSYASPPNNLHYCFPPFSHIFLTCPFYWHFSFGIQCDKFSS